MNFTGPMSVDLKYMQIAMKKTAQRTDIINVE
jgi:hypothetical protein